MSRWDNLSDAELDAIPEAGLNLRVWLYAVTAIDRKTRPDYPELDRALQRAVEARKRRGGIDGDVAGGGIGGEP